MIYYIQLTHYMKLKLISILLLSFASLSGFGQDSVLLVRQSRLALLMNKAAELNTTKKLVKQYDSIQLRLKKRIATKDSLIESLQKDNSYYSVQLTLLKADQAIDKKELQQLQKNYRKIQFQNFFLKTGIVVLVVIDVVVVVILISYD